MGELNFLFYLFFIGIFIASLQDLKKREVDNYLNFFIFSAGTAFLVFSSIFQANIKIILFGLVSFVVMLVISNIFYYARIFAGGDAKLMIAMFSLFAGLTLKSTLTNIVFFISLLLISGAIYGLIYSVLLFSFNFKKIKNGFPKEFKKMPFGLFFALAVILFIAGFFYSILFFFAVFVLVIPVLFAFGKVVEKEVMVKEIYAKDLREGDWLAQSVSIGHKKIKPNWEGLTKKDLILLRKLKIKVKVKDGIPFVPAFFIAFLAYVFLKSYFALLVI